MSDQSENNLNGETAYRKGQELAAASKNDAALLAFEEAFHQNSSDYKAVFGVGLMLQRLERHREAIDAFSRVISIRPDVAEGRYSRALSRQFLGSHSEALSDLDVALKLRPDFDDALYARGVSLKELGRYSEAVEVYSSILDRKVYPGASHGRATIRHMTGDYGGAVEDLSNCIRSGLDSYDVRLLRGLANHRLGRYRDAVEDLSRAISYRPEIGSTYFRRWQVYLEMGDKASAAKDLETGNRLLSNER